LGSKHGKMGGFMQTQVMIVGAGPVGLALACELARYGVRVRIVDKAAQRTDKSKALVLWSRSLELMDRGIGTRQFRENGFNVQAANFISGEKLVGRVDMGTVDSPYPYAMMIPQSETERLLEERLQELGVTVERSVEATATVLHR
jgi:2-polyprenyl-6-methoxyphenol hydroxylase-like FAD-dependent oxidoreductase